MALNRLKAGGRGLQPVPEESAANCTAADAHPDAAAAPVNPSEQCVKNSDGTYTNNGNAFADRRLRRWFSEDATAERHPPDNVPEKEYRIWFPRTEVSDEDPTGRASSDWRTFREYRYTECSRAGRLEKTLSVDEVFNSKDSPRTTAAHPPTSAFHCVSCSNSDEDKGGPLDVAGEERCRMLSSTKSELYREHRSQLLSRLEDDVTSPWEASSLNTDKKPKLSEASADTGSKKEARTSVCQTSSKKFAFDDDNSKTSSSDIPSWNEGALASAPAPRSLSGNENGSNSHQAVSVGLQDASLVSEDDDFDDSKCTYVKVDSVDSEVEDETDVGRETVIGAPSIDDLGYIAEEPEDDVEETTRDLGNQTSSANTTHEAAESERSCMMSSTAETSHQAPLSSKLGVKEAFKEAGERGNDLKFNESTLDTAVHLATDVNTIVGGKSLECRSDETKSVEQNAKQISHDHNEQKDIVEAALHHGDLSDTETNESDTKSEESVITVKSEATLLSTTRDQSIDEGLADTVTRSANEKENGLDTGETFITGERSNPEPAPGRTVDISVSSDIVNSQEKLGEDNEGITLLANVKEDLQKTSENVSVLVSECSSNSGASHCGTSIADNKSVRLTKDVIEFQETEYSRKDVSESLDHAVHESGQLFSETNAWHREMLLESQELTKNAAAHIIDISDHMEKILHTTSANVTNLLSSKCTFDSETGSNDEVDKWQHAETTCDRGRNDAPESMNEGSKGASNKVSELKEGDFLQFLKGGTLTEEVYGPESVTCLSKADDVTENTQESVTVIMDDSLLSREFLSDKKSTADELEGRHENPDVRQGVKNSAKNILQIGELLKQDTRQSAEMHFLKNTEALTQNMLMCFTGNEEYTKQTLKTVSSILSDSPRRKNIVHDDVAHILGDVKKRDKRLAEGGLKGPQEDTRQHFDDLALKNSHDFRDEGASHLHPAEMPNENVNKIQDTDVIAENGSMADNKENVPMILPDEHHLFKQPEISSVEGNEGTGVTRESNDELEIDNPEPSITQQCLAAHSIPEENSLSSSIKASMLKDVIALNRTDDATSFDDVSLQDDNDQGFESLPCDQTLDPEDLNEEQQLKDELDNAEKLLPADDDDNRGADKLTALLDELAEHEKAPPVSLQYDTGVQTTPTDVTDQNNEPVFEPKLRSLASNDDSDKEGSAQKCAHGIRPDENVHPAPAMSSDNEEQMVLSVHITGSKSGESSSAVPDEHEVTEIAGHKRDSEDISDACMEENTSKISEYYIDLPSVDTSGWQKSLQEKEEEKASEQIVKSDKYENEHSANQTTGVNKKIGIENAQTSEKESVDIAVATEASVRDERGEEFAMEKPVNKNSRDDEIAEVKTENLMGESSETAEHNEASVQCETSEGFPSNESVKKSTNDNELVKLELESSETKLRKNQVRDEESMQNEFVMEKPVNKSSSDNEIPEVKTENLMGESSETAAHNEASVQCETSEWFPSNESVKKSTNDNELVKLESESSETKLRKIEVRDEESMQNETSEEVACGPTAHPSSSDIGVPKLERESFIGEISELASTEASVPNETSEESESETPINRSTNDEVTVVKAETPVSEISETATSNEAGVQNETFEDFASEEPVSQSTGKRREETSTEQLAFTEARAQSNKYDQFANQRYPSHITDDQHDNNVNADASLSEFPQIAVIDELNVQSKTSDVLGSEESVNQSNANIEVTKAKAEASVNEPPKVVIPNEVSAQNTPEECASGETACPTTSDSDVTKVKAEVSNSEDPENVVSTKESERIEMMEESASEASVNENTNKMITRVEPDAPVSEFPETALSSESSMERKTCDELTSGEPANLGTNNNEVTKVNVQASVSEMTEILVSNEQRMYSTSEEFASEGTAHPNTSYIEITKVKAGTSFGEVPEIVVSDEASVRNEASEEPASEALMNLSTNEEIRVESDASVSDMPEEAVFNENSAENKTSGQLPCDEYGKQNDNDDENTKVKIVTSASELHEIIASNEATDQSKKSDEFASGEAERHSTSDVAITEAKEAASTSEVSQTTIADEASMQSETSAKFGNEAHVSETTNQNITEAKADTSTELPKIILSNEASVRNKPTKGFISEEPVNQGSNNEEIAKADEEEVGRESTETIAPNEASVQVVGVETEFQIIRDYEATKGPAETSTSVVPENLVSGEASLLSQTPEKFENEALGNDSPRDNAIPEVKSEASVSELPFNEASVQSIASEEFANGESTQETNGVVEVATLKADVPISEVPEIAVSNEVILPKKSHEELKNDAIVNESTNDNEVTEVMAGASVIELPEKTVPNEASIGNEISDELTSNENVHQSNSDKGNSELRPDTASDPPEIAEPDKANIQISEELAGEESVTRNIDDSDTTEVTPGTSVSKSPEFDGTRKQSECEVSSDTSDTCLECITKDSTAECIAAGGTAAQGQQEAAFECTSLPSNMAKTFANVDSHDEMTEDNETASTSAESADSELLGIARSGEPIEGGSIEEVNEVMEDVTGNSLGNVPKECIEINDLHRAHALEEERHRSQEESVHDSTHEKFEKQKSVYQFVEDEKNASQDIISEDSALKGAPAESCEAIDDHQTAQLGKDSKGVSHIILEDAADGASGASNSERSINTSELMKNSCEGMDWNNETLAQAADKKLGNVTLDSKERLRLTTTGSKLEESELLYHEISTSQEVVDATEPSTAEAYNANIAGISLNSSLEQENGDNRSSLLAYAEEIVSTVLTKCVTYLGESDEAFRRAELVGRKHCELNADTENAVKKKTISDDYKEEFHIPLPKSDTTNRDTPGDAFEPIASRQSAFEEAIPPADHQYPVTSRDANQAALVLPVAAEKGRNSNEKLNYAIMSEMYDQSVNKDEMDETVTNSEVTKLATSDAVAENAKVDVPLDSTEDEGLSQTTKKRRDGDASDSASISEALTEDGASSEAEPHSSASTAKENQEVTDQEVTQADQSEEKLEEEERSAVAWSLDAAGSDPPGGSETRRNFVESDNRGENVEPAQIVAATGRIIRQESQLNEESCSDSTACVHTKSFERSASDMEAPAADDAPESEEAENEATTNSFSESSVTTVSMNTEDSAESVSEFSTKASEQASDAVPANEVSEHNSGTTDMGHADAKNAPNNEFNETYSLDMPDSAADTNNNTAEGREEITSQPENRASDQGSNWQSRIPRNVDDGNGIGHQGWDMREQAKRTTAPESHDTFSQAVRSEVAVNNGENNKTSETCTETNFNSSARSNDEFVSKHESLATVDNDMESLGALSTVYESSLEYVRSYTDEHVSASNVTATVSRDYDAVGTTYTNFWPLKNSSAFGGVFENDEHSDDGKAELNSDESTVSAPSCPLQTDLSGGTGNDSIQHGANATSDPEVAPGSIREETAGAVGRLVDITGLSAGKMSTNTGEDRETNDFQVLKDCVTLQETRQAEVAVEGDLGDPIQSRKELEGNQGDSQTESGEYVTQYSKDTSAIGEQRSLPANSRNEGYIKGHDSSSRENDTENVVIPELFETKIGDGHETLDQVKQALEQDEVATMDFSDEEERSLEYTGAHEHIVFVDVHDIPISQESGDIVTAEIEQEGGRDEIVSSKTNDSAANTTDSNGKRDASSTEETNLAQLDTGVPVKNVEVEAEEPSATSTRVHVGSPHAESLSDKLPPAVEALKTAVMVHEETKLEALECSEDLLHSVATEADFSSDIYEQANDGLDADAGIDEDSVEQPSAGLPPASADISSAYGDQQVPTEECSGLDQEGAQIEIKERTEDDGGQHKISSSDAVEDTIVPEHIQSPSNKSSTESEAGSEKQDVVANGELKCAVEDFSRLISSDGSDVFATNRKSDEKGRIHDEAVIAEASNENVVPGGTAGEGDKESQPRNAAGAQEGDKVDNDNREDSLKTDSSESFDLSAAAGENVGESGSRNVKEDTTHKVTEAVEQSERTEGDDNAGSGDRVRSTRIFQRTVKRTESTRTVRRTRSFLPYAKWMRGEAHQRARQDARDEDVTEPVEEALVPQQTFPAMSIPRRGLCPMPDSPDGNVCSVAVQAFPSVVHQGVQVEFDEHDCITRLVELQIAMNEQEEVRRQDMKAACELVEKLEAMQLSESLMRTQLRAMDAERREQSAREARLRDELTAWQETVQQQQLLLQQLKEDLDDTEDTLAAQRQEANRLREQMLVLQESCDSGLLMVDVLGRADKEVQTPDSGQQPLSSSSPYKGIRLDSSSPVYLDQLSQHRRLSALVSSQLEATANRIAQLRREAAANRPRGSAIDEYVQDLAVGTDLQRSDAPPS